MRGCELTAYIYVWENFRLLELPWNSPWTWWLSFLGVDFCYYWVHRIAHGTDAHAGRGGGLSGYRVLTQSTG